MQLLLEKSHILYSRLRGTQVSARPSSGSNLNLAIYLSSVLTDSRKMVLCFSMNDYTIPTNSIRYCSFVRKYIRKSSEFTCFNNIEWINFFLSYNHFFYGEGFWRIDSVVRATPSFWFFDKNCTITRAWSSRESRWGLAKMTSRRKKLDSMDSEILS